VSSTPSAAVFSSTRATRRVPGIGAMSSPRVSSHASAVCAGVAPISAPMAAVDGADRLGVIEAALAGVSAGHGHRAKADAGDLQASEVRVLHVMTPSW
jgi:hypothetical protein